MSKCLNLKNDQQNKEIQLPADFADQILNLELQVQSNGPLNIQIISRLIELYSIGLQYYQSMKNKKYMVFKNKIVNLLLKPSVNQIMQNIHKQDQDKQFSQMNNKEARKKQLQNNIIFAVQNSQQQMRSIIRTANDRYRTIHKIINTGIHNQQEIVRQRIKSRKNNKKQVLSRQSTDGDPKEFSQINEFKKLQIKQNQIKICSQFNPLQKAKLQNMDMAKYKLGENNKNRRLSNINTNKQNIPQKVFSGRRRILSSRQNNQNQQLPSEYIIPF